MNKNFVLKGDIIFCDDQYEMKYYEDHYLICIDGKSEGITQKLPEQYFNLKQYDYSGKIIIPGLIDLHIHAPQYAYRGLGMDLELLDWLNEKAFPEEAKYEDLDYARKAYGIFSDAMRRSATTRACVFATRHVDATMILMDLLEETGLITYIGKVNMDRNAPDYLMDRDDITSEKDTIQWLEQCKNRYQRVNPILTPRFIPSCTDSLMRRLKKIQESYDLPVQSHLSEAKGEIQWVKELCPDSEFYGDAYDHFGLFGGDVRTIMAHCVASSEREIQRIKERRVYIAHCPQSNTNLSSGIAPVRRYLEEGIHIGLGSDVAGGSSESIFRAMVDAIQVSKLRNCLLDENLAPLSMEDVFSLATIRGGSFFGKVGSFMNGYELDAVVLDDSNILHPQELTLKERMERYLYVANEAPILHKFVAGKQLF